MYLLRHMSLEYEDEIKNEPKDLNESTKKFLSYFQSPLRYISLFITFYLIMSYIANKYIGGLFMNFFPMFLPVGKSFYPKPVLTSIFHQPLTENDDNNKFFKKDTLTSGQETAEKTYYSLLQLGGTIKQIVFGLFEASGTEATIDESKIYLADYGNLYWYQKFIVCIFGGLQILIGTVMTVFSLFAFLFSGKHGLFFNLLKSEKNGNVKTKPVADSILNSENNKLLLESGFSKFAAFFDFTYFIPVDKLSYGSTFFFRKKSTFGERFSYFFLVVFVLLLIGILRSSNVGGILGLIILIILMGGYVLNTNKTSHPYANYYGLKAGVFKNSKIKTNTNNCNNNDNNDNNVQATFNEIQSKMDNVKTQLKDLMQQFTEKSKKTKNEMNTQQTGGKLNIQPQFKEKIEQLRNFVKENNLKI